MLQQEKQDQFKMFWNYTTKISEQSRELGRLRRTAIDRSSARELSPHAAGGGWRSGGI